MKNICFVGLENLPVLAREYNQHGIGGEQVQQTLLAKALRDRGFNVSMVISDYGQLDGSVWHGITTYKAYRPSAGLPLIRFIHPRWTGIWSALKRSDAEIYYTSCAGMMVGIIAIFCMIYRRGLVFRLASDTDADPKRLLVRYRRDKWLYSFGLRNADAVLSQHGVQKSMLIENYGVTSSVADMLVDPPSTFYNLSQRSIKVLWVNNLRDLKRPDLAIELARCMSFTLHMIGGPQIGFESLYENIQREAISIPNIRFYGRVAYHDIGDFFDRARVFVNTSDIEGFPNSYLQAWRRGVPVVAFFDPDGLIKREGLGYAVSNIEEMRKVVERLLSDDTEWSQISIRCRAYMERHHGDDVVLKPYLSAFKQAHSARRSA